MADKYELKPFELSRVRYYDGEYLKDDEFIDEQRYHIDRRQRHDRLLHVAGVCEGLTISLVNPATIKVAPGTAIDDQGHTILLGVEQTIAVKPEYNGALFVQVQFREIEDRPADANSAVAANTRFTQAPVLSLSSAVQPHAVVLGQAVISNGQASQVTATGRVYSGLRLPGPGNAGYVLHARGDSAPGVVDLECSLSVTGSVQVSGSRITNKSGFGIVQTDADDWLRVNPDSKYPGTAMHNPVAIGTGGLAVGDWTQMPQGQLKVTSDASIGGKVRIGAGSPKVEMASGSLTIGNTAASFGGGSGWNDNTAGLLLETKKNTEIAVHDWSTRLASLMFYEGDTDNRLTIGRDMGGGALGMLMVAANTVQLSGSRLKNSAGFAIVETNATDWLRINPDSKYPAIALHNPVAIGFGGLTVGDWSQLPTGQLKVTSDATIGGKATVQGDIYAASSAVYFTNTAHDHSGIGDTAGYAAIENAKNHDALMILGRAGTSKGRLVKLWDYLQVNGTLESTGEIVGAGGLQLGGNIKYNQLAKLDVADAFTATVRCADFCIGYSSRRGSPGRALVDNKTSLVVNCGADWPSVEVASDLKVNRKLTVGGGWASSSEYMAPGSVTIGDINANFGGGSGWHGNTAGLMLETTKNTEIAVHDSNTRVASLMFYEGDADHRLTIGRDMGWGRLDTLLLGASNVGINDGALGFGAQVRQMINLWYRNYGIGVQNATLYFRTDKNVAFYKGGGHSNNELDGGGGSLMMTIDPDKVTVPSQIYSPNRLHIHGEERLYLLNKDGVHISTAWGGSGSLYVSGSVSVNSTVRLNNPTPANGVSSFGIYYESGNNTVVFYHNTGAGQYMRQDGAWHQNSDATLKTNIIELDGVLAKIMQLRPVSFDWKTCAEKGIGFVAQDVEAVFPEIVSTRRMADGTSLKGLPYDTFAVLAVAAIKEMNHRYEKRIAELEGAVATLRASASSMGH